MQCFGDRRTGCVELCFGRRQCLNQLCSTSKSNDGTKNRNEEACCRTPCESTSSPIRIGPALDVEEASNRSNAEQRSNHKAIHARASKVLENMLKNIDASTSGLRKSPRKLFHWKAEIRSNGHQPLESTYIASEHLGIFVVCFFVSINIRTRSCRSCCRNDLAV